MHHNFSNLYSHDLWFAQANGFPHLPMKCRFESRSCNTWDQLFLLTTIHFRKQQPIFSVLHCHTLSCHEVFEYAVEWRGWGRKILNNSPLSNKIENLCSHQIEVYSMNIPMKKFSNEHQMFIKYAHPFTSLPISHSVYIS